MLSFLEALWSSSPATTWQVLAGLLANIYAPFLCSLWSISYGSFKTIQVRNLAVKFSYVLVKISKYCVFLISIFIMFLALIAIACECVKVFCLLQLLPLPFPSVLFLFCLKDFFEKKVLFLGPQVYLAKQNKNHGKQFSQLCQLLKCQKWATLLAFWHWYVVYLFNSN